MPDYGRFPTLQTQLENGVLTVTLNRPERLNAVGDGMHESLEALWGDIAGDTEVRSVVLTGAGRAFCAGADLARDPNDPDAGHNPASLMEKLERDMAWSYKPMIAAVNGHCYGRGFYFALDCDIRIASDKAVFCFAEPRWNFAERWVPKLAATIPPATALWMLATTKEVPAERALQLGLVADVVPHDKLMEEATELAERICQNGPLAVRAGLQIIRTMINDQARAKAPLAEELGTRVGNSEDSRSGEAQRAFAEKRKPVWRGR